MQDRSWELTKVGHWQRVTTNEETVPYLHGPSHELTQVGNATVAYDGNGNRRGSAGSLVFTWDPDDRLSSVIDSSGDADNHTFEYDALGRRVALTIGRATKILVCDGQQLIAVYDLDTLNSPNRPQQSFVYGSYIDEPLMMVSGSGDQHFFSRNQQYSITALTNATGNVVERYVYDAYGETVVLSAGGTPQASSSFGNPFTYTGRYHHTEIGLMYFRARYYDPGTGEFISRDPLGYVDGMSLYRGYFVPGAMDPEGTDRLKKVTSSSICPQPCDSTKSCNFELGLSIEYRTPDESKKPQGFVGPVLQIPAFVISMQFNPEVPEDPNDLNVGNQGPVGCYGGFNRAPKGFINYTLWNGKKCEITSKNFPGTNPNPIPPGDPNGIDKECFGALGGWGEPGDDTPTEGVDGAEYWIDKSKIKSIHVNFTIETECHCGIGHCDIPDVEPEFSVNTTPGTISINEQYNFFQVR